MERLPSIAKLEEAFPGKGEEMRLLLERKSKTTDYKSVQFWERECYHRPKYIDRLMCALNEITGCHGVEAIMNPETGEPDMEYLNVGDTYAATLIRDYTTGTWKVQCIGDWIEIAERGGRRYD